MPKKSQINEYSDVSIYACLASGSNIINFQMCKEYVDITLSGVQHDYVIINTSFPYINISNLNLV